MMDGKERSVHRRVLVVVAASVVTLAACTPPTTTVAPTNGPTPVPSLLLSPAPRPPGSLHQCPFELARASVIPPASLAPEMQNHVPHWLPSGMGLVEAFGPGNGALGGAYFADARCREVELWFWKSTDVGAGPRVGAWTVTASPHACANALLLVSLCLDYHAKVQGGSIGVQMMGIPRSEGDKLVQSIPV